MTTAQPRLSAIRHALPGRRADKGGSAMRRLLPLWVAGLCLLASAPAWAQVDVFTVAGVPVTHVPDDANVVELDKPSRLDKRLSDGLPADQDKAARIVRKRAHGLKQAYGEAYMGLWRAWNLGVKQVPAVVVDGQYVVYGQPNVAAAVAEIEAARTKEN